MLAVTALMTSPALLPIVFVAMLDTLPDARVRIATSTLYSGTGMGLTLLILLDQSTAPITIPISEITLRKRQKIYRQILKNSNYFLKKPCNMYES